MAIQSKDERERTAKRSKAASQALKGKLGKPAPGAGPKKIARTPLPPASRFTTGPEDNSVPGADDEYGMPLSGVELFKQHFARNQELGLGDGRGNVHTDELQLPRGTPDSPTFKFEPPPRRNVFGVLPGENGGLVDFGPGGRKVWEANQAKQKADANQKRPAPQPQAQAPRPDGPRQQAPAQRAAAPAPGGRPRMVQMGEEEQPQQEAPPRGRRDMAPAARNARVNQAMRKGMGMEDANRAVVHDEFEASAQAAQDEHTAAMEAARSAPRQPTQNDMDDDRMARDWRDRQVRGKGVDAQNEREANESSNAGALAALDARENRRDTRFEDRMARSIAFDKAEKAKRDAARAADQAADPEGFAIWDAARKQQLRDGLEKRRNESSVAQMVRTYGEDHMNEQGFGPNARIRAGMDGKSAGKMRANLYNRSTGNAAQQVAARNSQRARRDARMRGLGPEIAEDTMVAAGDDPNRQGAAFAIGGQPRVGGNIIANNIAAKANQPPAPAQPDMMGEIHALYGPGGVIERIRNTVHPGMQEGALRSLLTEHGMDATQVEHAVEALRGPQVGMLERAHNFWFGKPVPPPPDEQPDGRPKMEQMPAPNAVGAATGYLDPRSVARGMQGPRMLRGLA